MIGTAIKSVLSQTFEDWELIVIDDGGKDNTKEVVESFGDPRISYHWQENQELNGARNAGISLAKGRYIGLLDDDDFFLENHLDVHHAVLSNLKEKSISKSGVVVNLRNGKEKKLSLFNSQNESSIEYVFREQQGIHSFFFDKKIFEELKFDDRFKLYDDDHFLIRAFLKFPLIQTDSYTVHYIKHEDNRTDKYISKPEMLQSYLDAYDDILLNHKKELTQHISIDKLENFKRHIMLNSAIRLIKQGHKKEAKSLIQKSGGMGSLIKNPTLALRIFYNSLKH